MTITKESIKDFVLNEAARRAESCARTEGITPGGGRQRMRAPDMIRNYCKLSGIELNWDEGKQVYYKLSEDAIYRPTYGERASGQHLFQSIFHEMIHSTGTAGRLSRPLTGNFYTKQYAREELTAEMGSAILCAYTSTGGRAVEDEIARYVFSWAEVVSNHFSDTVTEEYLLEIMDTAENAAQFIIATSERGTRQIGMFEFFN